MEQIKINGKPYSELNKEELKEYHRIVCRRNYFHKRDPNQKPVKEMTVEELHERRKSFRLKYNPPNPNRISTKNMTPEEISIYRKERQIKYRKRFLDFDYSKLKSKGMTLIEYNEWLIQHRKKMRHMKSIKGKSRARGIIRKSMRICHKLSSNVKK